MALFGNPYLHRDGQGKARFGTSTYESDGEVRIWEHVCTDPFSQTWLKLTQSLGRPGVVDDEKQGKEEVYIPQGALEGTERASGTRRSTLLGPTDTQGPHCHLMTCPGFCPQF